jgi:hypothetical protein
VSEPPSAARRRRLAGWLRALLYRGFMPFRTDTPLSSAERRMVAGVWGATGAIFACLWTAVLGLLLRGTAIGRLGIVAAGLVLGAGLFFAAAGYLMATIGSTLIRRGHRGSGEGRGHRGPNGANT